MAFDFDSITTIIVKPDEKYAKELLRTGPLGSAPPTVWYHEPTGDSKRGKFCTLAPRPLHSGEYPEAVHECLALVYDGEILRRGFEECKAAISSVYLRTPLDSIVNAYAWALSYQRNGLGTVLFFDADNNQIVDE